ncbi:MAG: bifunctional riboflavin kinase/FAD synthetase [Burkholderiales bacterium]
MQVIRGVPALSPALSTTPCALTIGNFDGVHLGHQAMLAQLRAAAEVRKLPACVMTFEPHPREFFTPDDAPTRMTTLREKLELLASFGVDKTYVCRFNKNFSSLSAQDFIDDLLVRRLQTKWLLVGDDFRFGAKRAGDFAFLTEAATRSGFELAKMQSFTHKGERVSSTAVRNALARGDLARAQELLGRAYSISGRVMHGNKLGREIGFPTANIQMRHNRPPLKGIFAVHLHVAENGVLTGVASLGLNPTVSDNASAKLEVHVFDFDGDLYGKHVQVEFLKKLRDEEKYTDLEKLKKQIQIDADQARIFLSS